MGNEFWVASPKHYEVTDKISYDAGLAQGDQYQKYFTLEQLMSCKDDNFFNAINNSKILYDVYNILKQYKDSTHPAIVQLQTAFENMSPYYKMHNNGQQFEILRDGNTTRSRLIPLLMDLQEAIDYYNQTVAAAANKN